MAKYFQTNISVGKSGAGHLSNNRMIGNVLGFWGAVHSNQGIQSIRSNVARNFITSNNYKTDARLFLQAAWIASQQWARENANLAPSLDSSDLALCHYVIDLFCKWVNTSNAGGASEWNLQSMDRQMSQLWRGLTVQAQGAFKASLLTKIRGAYDSTTETFNDIGALREAGLHLDVFAATTHHHTIYTGTLAGTSFQMDNANVPNTADEIDGHLTDVDVGLGYLYLWSVAKREENELKSTFTRAVSLLLSVIVKDQPPTVKWINSRNVRLASMIGVDPASLSYDRNCTEFIKSMVKFRNLNPADYQELIIGVKEWGNRAGISPVGWSLDQAAYTGVTIVTTMIANLAAYSSMPWGLLFQQVGDELRSFLRACMFAYLHPYHGLKEIKYPATTFPNIATAAIQIANDLGKTTYSAYRGVYPEAQLSKYELIVRGFNTMRDASQVGDIISKHLGAMIPGISDYRMTRNHMVITLGTANAPRPAINLPPLLQNKGTFDPNANTLTLNASDVLLALRQHDIDTGSADVQLLYRSVEPLHSAFVKFSLGDTISLPVPEDTHALYPLYSSFTAAEFHWA